MKVERKPRLFVSEDLQINDFADVKPYFDELLDAEFSSKDEFELWLKKNSELEAVLEEDLAWRYIKMTVNTADEGASASYNKFITEINPKIAEVSNALNKKLNGSPYKSEFTSQADQIYFKKIETALQIFREENIELFSESATLAQEYSGVIGAQLITYKGEELTSQQAAIHLKDPDRSVREEVYKLLQERKAKDNDKLEEIFDKLVEIRHSIAVNAGFENFRDYKFKAMNRFDYSVQDCFDFHKSIEEYIVPIYRKIQQEKLDKFGFEKFRPWDTSADPEGKPPLKPFETGEELLSKTVDVFEKIDPYFSDCLLTMKEMGHLDLESKKGKAPGGYNYPLYEIGIPFIFMNAASSARDVITMVHEGGHAVHSFLTKELDLTAYKSFPSEVAELASMSMELLSMKYWEVYYSSDDDLNRAKKEHLESILMVLPWIATIDAFQHWIYENPGHSRDERKAKWNELAERFGSGLTDWSDFEFARDYAWHKQLHLYEVPFYYIEYGFSQLGALGVWHNALENEKEAIDKYKEGLSLGYTTDIKSIYKAAGVEFDFSAANIRSLSAKLVDFLDELK